MVKNIRKGGPDLLALAMRRARDDVAEGRVPKHPPNPDAALELADNQDDRPAGDTRRDNPITAAS